MAVLRVIFLAMVIFVLGDRATGDSDLTSALAAINRRERELAEYHPQQQYQYDRDAGNYYNPEDRGEEEEEEDDSRGSLKRVTSSFRERLEENREKQLNDFLRSLYNNLEAHGVLDQDYVKSLWERYYGNDVNYINNALKKRIQQLDNSDNIYLVHHHVPRSEEVDDYPMAYWKAPSSSETYKSLYGGGRGLSVSKRSNSNINKEEKRSVKKQTDPKVEQDLSDIFNGYNTVEMKDNALVEETSTTPQPEEVTKTRKIEKKDKPKMDEKDQNKVTDEITKEVYPSDISQNEKPRRLDKKSIDWSDYFGLDRRKKSESNNNNLDKEWLMERYHKAIAITAKKKDHQAQASKKTQDNAGKLSSIDKKLENMEEEIIDNILKYTGAHYGEYDLKKVQQVKENIMAQLAEAYNIEKMRNQLKGRERDIEDNRAQEEISLTDYPVEDKRVAVPRKEAVDENKEVTAKDNNIKCTSSEDCYEQNYGLANDEYSNIACPIVNMACDNVGLVAGPYANAIVPACILNQMCMLCNNNSWFVPTRQCNVLFVAKAYELCQDKEECKRATRRSLEYLRSIYKSLQEQPALTNECELLCPELSMK